MKKSEIIPVLLIMGVISLGCGYGNWARQTPEPTRTNFNSNSNSSPSVANNSSNAQTKNEPIYKMMEDKANELGKTQTTVKLAPKATIKGKVAVVAKKYEFSEDYEIEGFNAYKTDFSSESDLKRLALTKERMAVKPDEIETLIHINCNQGKSIGRYVSPTGGKSVPAYSMVCKVSLIDFQTKTVIAQKTLENRTLEQTVSISNDDKKYVNLAPWAEIEKYLKSFPSA